MKSAAALALVMTVSLPAAADDCPGSAWLTGGIAAGAGVAASFASSGVAFALGGRDYDYFVGAGVGAGVTAGLALAFALVDGNTGCTATRDGVAWGAPIAMFVAGGALPLMIWGASGAE